MTIWLALAGWALATVLAVQCARISRRLELVARADHELRSPVSALSLAVESLRREPGLHRRARALDAHLDRLRLGLADLAAARAGSRARPWPGRLRPESVAATAVEAWRPAAAATGRRVELDWRVGETDVCADPARLSQALGNLLGNALEHGGGDVSVRGERSDRGLRIAVSDGGRVAPMVVESARGRRRPRGGRSAGRGRGLKIAAEAVAETGGVLDAGDLERTAGSRRAAPDGTTVSVELPVAGEAEAGEGRARTGRSRR